MLFAEIGSVILLLCDLLPCLVLCNFCCFVLMFLVCVCDVFCRCAGNRFFVFLRFLGGTRPPWPGHVWLFFC